MHSMCMEIFFAFNLYKNISYPICLKICFVYRTWKDIFRFQNEQIFFFFAFHIKKK